MQYHEEPPTKRQIGLRAAFSMAMKRQPPIHAVTADETGLCKDVRVEDGIVKTWGGGQSRARGVDRSTWRRGAEPWPPRLMIVLVHRRSALTEYVPRGSPSQLAASRTTVSYSCVQ